jgi:hypothetical protein
VRPSPAPSALGQKLLLSQSPLSAKFRQRRRRDIGPEELAGDAVGLVLVLARQREGARHEARDVPREGSPASGRRGPVLRRQLSYSRLQLARVR